MDDPIRFFGVILQATVLMVLLSCGVIYLLTRCGG